MQSKQNDMAMRVARSFMARDDEPTRGDYPDGLYDDVTIKLKLINGRYHVSCREWRTDFPSANPADDIKKLVSQIVYHNHEELKT